MRKLKVQSGTRQRGFTLSEVLMVVLIMGTLMYVVEGPANGYTSIPLSVYWAVTTMTTVGFGDTTGSSNPKQVNDFYERIFAEGFINARP